MINFFHKINKSFHNKKFILNEGKVLMGGI